MKKFALVGMMALMALASRLGYGFQTDFVSIENLADPPKVVTLHTMEAPYLRISRTGAAKNFWAARADRLDRIHFNGQEWEVTTGVLTLPLTDLAQGESAQSCFLLSGNRLLHVVGQDGKFQTSPVVTFPAEEKLKVLCADLGASGNFFVAGSAGSITFRKMKRLGQTDLHQAGL